MRTNQCVGWVERSETHHAAAVAVDGFRFALPILRNRDSERLALRERLLDHELGRLAVIAFDESLAVEQGPRVRHQRRAAADHDAVMDGIERGEANISEQFS